MAEFPGIEEIAKKVAETALDSFEYQGKTIREWVKIIVEQGWIPITEKEPTKGERVLMTLKNDETDKEVVIGTMSMNLDGKFHIDDCGALYVFDKPTVIAWMPLPPSYQGE